MATFERIVTFSTHKAAVFSEPYRVGLGFTLDEKSLRARIENLERQNIDTTEEKVALNILTEGVIISVDNCPLRQRITASPTGSSMSSWGCLWTGGHCIPDEKCGNKREQHQKEQAEIEEKSNARF